MKKNRLSRYEAGWLSMLVVSGLATKESIRRARRRTGVRETGPRSITDLHEERVHRLQQREQDRRRSG